MQRNHRVHWDRRILRILFQSMQEELRCGLLEDSQPLRAFYYHHFLDLHCFHH